MRPVSRIRRSASAQSGSFSPGCSQWATDASSHHSINFGIACLCAPPVMYARMLAWLSHAVIVQNVQLRCTCVCVRIACMANRGTNRIERSRKRVRLTKTMP